MLHINRSTFHFYYLFPLDIYDDMPRAAVCAKDDTDGAPTPYFRNDTDALVSALFLLLM